MAATAPYTAAAPGATNALHALSVRVRHPNPPWLPLPHGPSLFPSSGFCRRTEICSHRARLFPPLSPAILQTNQVYRLAKPSLNVETSMRFALDDLGHTAECDDRSVPEAVAASLAPGGGPPEAFERRLDLLNAEHASGITGMLALPQGFG